MIVIDLVGSPLDGEYRCLTHRVSGNQIASCVNELVEAGFYQYTTNQGIARAMRASIESLDDYGYVFFDYTNREARMDTEDINECGILEFLNDVGHFSPCSNIRNRFVSEGYDGRINYVRFVGVECRVWDFSEFEDSKLSWLLSGDRAIKMMNRLLEIEGHEDRLYYYHAGNDSQAFLVTPSILEILTKYGAVTLNIE